MTKTVRRLYDWVLHWAHTPYGTPALAGLSFSESSIFPIPPDVLLVALCLGRRDRSWYYATVCSVASVVGGIFGYLIGWGFWALVSDFFFTYVPGFTVETFERVHGLYEHYNFLIVFVAAFTPIPYKVITITAGVFGINLPMFILASAVGRSLRFFMVAGLIYKFGEPIKDFIDRRFNMLSWAFTIVLVLGFVLLNYAW